MRCVLPVVAEGSERVRLGGRTVREGDRAERRLAHRGEIKEESEVSRYRSIVAGRQLDEEIVRVLAVVQRGAAVGFTGLEEERVAATSHGPRLGAEHGSQLEASLAQVAARGEHAPIDGDQ